MALEITLRKNNTPTKPGIYLVLWPDESHPKVAVILDVGEELSVYLPDGVLSPLETFLDVLWSDSIKIKKAMS